MSLTEELAPRCSCYATKNGGWYRLSPYVSDRLAEMTSDEVVQTHEAQDWNVIASASSANCGDMSICMWVRKKSAFKLQGHNKRKTGHNVLQWVMVLVTIILLYQNLVSYRFGDVRHVQQWAISRVASLLTGKQDAVPHSHITSEMKQTTETETQHRR